MSEPFNREHLLHGCRMCDKIVGQRIDDKLKLRAEMDEEAAMRKFKEFWDRPFVLYDQDTLRAVLDAAFGEVGDE